MRRFAWILLCGAILFLIFGCDQTQEKPTVEKLAQDLAKALNSFLTNPTGLDNYVKTLTTDTDVLAKKSEYLNDLRDTLTSLGNKIELLRVEEFTSKAPIYSYDLGMKPNSVDKVYIMTLLVKDEAQQRQNIYSLPFITLKNEADKIYLALIFKREGNVIVYPKPIQQ